MYIAPLKYNYQAGINYRSQNFKAAHLNSASYKELPHISNKMSCLKKLFLSAMMAFTLLVSTQSCEKEPYGPHPTGYQPTGVTSNNGYPDAPQDVMDEFIAWYEENCPIWNWPDYEGPYPDNWSELREQFQQDVVNWWHEHGYPDWNGKG